MKIFDKILKKNNNKKDEEDSEYEFCPRCDANLRLQKGFNNEDPFWVCKGCGEMLINPNIETEDNIAWICDGCGCMLNIQNGFSNSVGEWKCLECGYINKIDESEIYATEEEYQLSLNDPTRGLSDNEILELSVYDEVDFIDGRSNVILVKNLENGKLYVKKYLKDYDLSVFKYLMDNPIEYMPRLIALYEGSNNLIVIEEYIKGKTLFEMLEIGCLEEFKAIEIAKKICYILLKLQSGEKTIIHRDIKPSNIIISDDNNVYLLDINVAKWYKSNEIQDTRLLGTKYFAAPEQYGLSFTASSKKTDVYAVGVLLNVMIMGKIPKVEKANGPIWNIIDKCISLEAENRYSVEELIAELEGIKLYMEEKKTCDLDKFFENAKMKEVTDYLKENKSSMKDSKKEFYYYMKNVIESKNIMLKKVYLEARVDENYAGKIIRMEKHTSNRDLIIRLCLAGQFTLDETNRALKLYGMNPLYSKISRDACLIAAINNRIYDIDKINEFLEKNDVEKFIIKDE